MNQPIEKLPPYADIIRDLLASTSGPVPCDSLADQILVRHPSSAKNPHRAVLAKIHEEAGRQLVFVDPKHVLALRLAFQEARYRIRLTKDMVERAAIPYGEWFRSYLPSSFDKEDLSLINAHGFSIPFQWRESPGTSFFGPVTNIELVLKEWFRSEKMYHKDHILVTIQDWENGILCLERERFGDQKSDVLSRRNQAFADAMYQMLESAAYEDISVHIVLPTLYARMADKEVTPPDHWMMIVNQDPRMKTDGFSINYIDGKLSMFEQLIGNSGRKSQTKKSQMLKRQEPYKEGGQHIFRFRAQLTHNPSIWREVEIQGKQTLADLDDILRIAFQHDTSDHLSGFWKRVARDGGSRKRYRQVDLGTVNPFEPGEGSDTKIATLKLQVGDQLKYVYDFGDWIEHILELKSIGEPEKGILYPQEFARNKPKYKLCVECQAKGKETTATWVCVTCSNEQQRDVLVCEECMENHDEDYTVEILY